MDVKVSVFFVAALLNAIAQWPKYTVIERLRSFN